MDDEIKRLGGDWPPLKAGVLEGSIEEIKQAKQAFDRYIEGKEWGY